MTHTKYNFLEYLHMFYKYCRILHRRFQPRLKCWVDKQQDNCYGICKGSLLFNCKMCMCSLYYHKSGSYSNKHHNCSQLNFQDSRKGNQPNNCSNKNTKNYRHHIRCSEWMFHHIKGKFCHKHRIGMLPNCKTLMWRISLHIFLIEVVEDRYRPS